MKVRRPSGNGRSTAWQECRSPEHFEQATELVTLEMTRDSVVAGNDPADHLEQARQYAEAGYDELYIANRGPHYKDMVECYGEKVLPDLR